MRRGLVLGRTRQRLRSFILAIALFGLAIIMKYHAVLLLPLVWLEDLSRPGANYRKAFVRLCAISCAILLGPVIYIVAVKKSLGFWLAPPVYQGIHHLLLTPSFAITNFIILFGIYCPASYAVFWFLPLWEHAHSLLGVVKIYRWWAAPVHTRLFRCRSDWGNGLWPP